MFFFFFLTTGVVSEVSPGLGISPETACDIPSSAAERAISTHISQAHPSQEEKVGRAVLGLLPIKEENRKKVYAIITLIGAILTYFGIDLAMPWGVV